jgi:hypothetical protein
MCNKYLLYYQIITYNIDKVFFYFRGGIFLNRIPVVSSNLKSVAYEFGILEVEFNSGGIYSYTNVPEHIYKGLLNASSKGQYFNAFIKDNYPYNKIL